MIDTWMTPYIWYLADQLLPSDPGQAKIVKKNASRYTLVDGYVFRHGYIYPLLTCRSEDQYTRIIFELHEGICGSHTGERALSLKIIQASYYWSSMKKDSMAHTRNCEQCQKHVDWHHAPAKELHSISSPWLFHKWGIDILGPLLLAVRQLKYLIVAVEYFTKWIEAQLMALITT